MLIDTGIINLFRPGTRLTIEADNTYGFRKKSIIHIAHAMLDEKKYAVSIKSILENPPPTAGQASIKYSVIIEQMGKAGRKRKEITVMQLPLLLSSANKDIQNNFSVDSFYNIMEEENNIFLYWFLSRSIYNKYIWYKKIEQIKYAPALIKFKEIEIKTKQVHTEYVLNNTVETIQNYFNNKEIRVEALLELREHEARLKDETIYYVNTLTDQVKKELLSEHKEALAKDPAMNFFKHNLTVPLHIYFSAII